MASGDGSVVSADTNVAIYARSDGEKASRARTIMASCDFLSVQVLNEFASASRRKFRRSWDDIGEALADIRTLVPDIRSIEARDNEQAVRLASRYQLQLYDAVMIAVALANGATTLYSEDMHHGLMVDKMLRIVDPFRAGPEQ